MSCAQVRTESRFKPRWTRMRRQDSKPRHQAQDEGNAERVFVGLGEEEVRSELLMDCYHPGWVDGPYGGPLV